jgi:GT2 family glycosyltransferase
MSAPKPSNNASIANKEAQLTLCIIIVNWNSNIQLEACFGSIMRQVCPDELDLQVKIVDNASTDGSCDFLAGRCGSQVSLLQSEANGGFARGCNMGYFEYQNDHGTPDFALFLNPDTEIPDTHFFQSLVSHEILQDTSYGIFGVQMFNEEGTSITCSQFPSVMNYTAQAVGLSVRAVGLRAFCRRMVFFDHETSQEVDQVMGAFFLVRGPLFARLHGFDERFFVYFEEVDFSLRAVRAGSKSYFLASPSIYHYRGGTTETNPALRLCLSIESRLRYFRKHFGVVSSLWIWLISFSIEPSARVARAMFRGDFKGAADVMGGYRLLTQRMWSR